MYLYTHARARAYICDITRVAPIRVENRDRLGTKWSVHGRREVTLERFRGTGARGEKRIQIITPR